jgi:branched-subunit amino acid ABC-type transport system permease component
VRQLNILLLGLGNGGIYALLGQSTVLVYRGSRVLNLASAAIGMFGAYVFYHRWVLLWSSAWVPAGRSVRSCIWWSSTG